MEILILNDGTEVNGHIMEDGDGMKIFVYLDGKSVIEGVMLFTPERASRITARNHGEEHVYEGYTDLWSASHEYGNCNLVMKKGAA